MLLADGTVLAEVDQLLIGAGNVNAFVGINGPYLLDDSGTPSDTSDDVTNGQAIGLSLQGVEFGLAMLSIPQPTLAPP